MGNYIDMLAIEITRRCNEKCKHCLRGPAEDVSMHEWLIERISRKFYGSRIGSLIITGGEPSLEGDNISRLVSSMLDHKISIANFYVATNGKDVRRDFMVACLDLYAACDDNEISRVELSSSIWHEKIDVSKNPLAVLTFASRKGADDGGWGRKKYEHESILKEGRATAIKESDTVTITSLPSPEQIDVEENEGGDKQIYDRLLYINVIGDIYSECNMSYARQRRNAMSRNGYYVGSILSSRTIFDQVEKYNQRIRK